MKIHISTSRTKKDNLILGLYAKGWNKTESEYYSFTKEGVNYHVDMANLNANCDGTIVLSNDFDAVEFSLKPILDDEAVANFEHLDGCDLAEQVTSLSMELLEHSSN